MISECKAYYITSRKEEISGMGESSASVRGKMTGSVEHEGEWIAVCAYGTIGAPKKGFEHEAIGFGFNHI